MDVTLTPGMKAFVRQAIASGHLHYVQEAPSLWEVGEWRRRLEIALSVESAREAHARSDGLPMTAESMRDLANEVKSRGRDHLAADRHPHD